MPTHYELGFQKRKARNAEYETSRLKEELEEQRAEAQRRGQQAQQQLQPQQPPRRDIADEFFSNMKDGNDPCIWNDPSCEHKANDPNCNHKIYGDNTMFGAVKGLKTNNKKFNMLNPVNTAFNSKKTKKGTTSNPFSSNVLDKFFNNKKSKNKNIMNIMSKI